MLFRFFPLKFRYFRFLLDFLFFNLFPTRKKVEKQNMSRSWDANIIRQFYISGNFCRYKQISDIFDRRQKFSNVYWGCINFLRSISKCMKMNFIICVVPNPSGNFYIIVLTTIIKKYLSFTQRHGIQAFVPIRLVLPYLLHFNFLNNNFMVTVNLY